MEGAIQEVKDKIDIVELISSYIPVKKAGRNFKANCPFHSEKTPSFVISPDRQIWHCFGSCNDGGDAINFIMKLENITFFEALKELALKAGIPLQKISIQDTEWQKKERLYQINALSTEFFQYILNKTPYGKVAKEYLKNRGTSEAIANTFQLGYSPNSWDSLLKFLLKKSFSPEEISRSGIVVKNDSGKLYDRFRGRLMFPIKDIRGNVIGFSGRILDKKDSEAKYINTPETEIYHKRESLFGIYLAKEAIKKENNVLLVEGEFDMISPYQYSIENVVAVKGSALTKEQLTLLKRLTTKLTFAFDADKAGAEAVKKAIQEAEKMDFEMYVLDWGDEAKDPDEMVRNHLVEFKNKLKSPVSIYDFIIKLAQKKYGGESAFDKKKLSEEVSSFIASIKNPIIQSHYVKKVAGILEVSEDSVLSLLKQSQQKTTFQQFLPKSVVEPKINREELMEKYLLSCLFQHEKTYVIADLLTRFLIPEDFSVVAYQKIVKNFIPYKNQHEKPNMNDFCDSLPAELQSVCNELFLFNIDELEAVLAQRGSEKNQIEKIVLQIKKTSLKKAIQHLLFETKDDDSSKEEELTRLNTSLKEVDKMIGSVYN
jgi:DNA primase